MNLRVIFFGLGVLCSAVFSRAGDPAVLVGEMRGRSMQGRAIVSNNGEVRAREAERERILADWRALGEKGLPALSAALTDGDVQLRRNAALVLNELAFPWTKPGVDLRGAIPALTRATTDVDALVRSWSAQALGFIGPAAESAVPALRRLLKDPSVAARNGACIALGQMGRAAEEAIPMLEEMKRSDNEVDRGLVVTALGRIEGARALPR